MPLVAVCGLTSLGLDAAAAAAAAAVVSLLPQTYLQHC
jgi:hypothetical protein